MSTLIIGLGKKKPGMRPSMPPPEAPGGKRQGRVPRPPRQNAPEPEPDGDEQSISPEEVCYKADDLCEDCAHFDGQNCSKYGFAATGHGHCANGFEAKSGGADNSQMDDDDQQGY
jgi:hypothetical protein